MSVDQSQVLGSKHPAQRSMRDMMIIHGFLKDPPAKPKTYRVGPLSIRASRWPWMEEGAYNRGGMGRFGGGWHWCLGIEVSRTGTIMLNLIWGIVTISKYKKPQPAGAEGGGETHD